MAEEVQAAGVFELRAEGGDFRAEIADLTEVAKRFERATVDAFNRAGKAASDTAALEASSKRYVSAIEREALATERKTAALVLSGAEMRKAEAAGRGETANAAAAIARLEASEAAYKSLSSQMAQMRDINVFGDMLAKSTALGQVGKNIDAITAALDRLDGEAKTLGQTKVFEARVAEAAKLGMAEQYMASYARAGNSMVAAEKAFAADRSFVDGLKRRSDSIGKTQADLLELEAAERGVSQQAAPFIANLRAQERALGIYSAGARDARVQTNQMRTALAQLPMQFTDIFTSLAGGQNPLLVLIQQGGQIKDSFGGIGNALRGIGGAITAAFTPVTVAVGTAVAAVGTLGYALIAGEREAAAYRQALVLTGNAAGATAGQLQDAAAAVARSVGTQGKAAEVIAALAATGRVAGRDLGLLAEAAIRLEREGGPAVKDTVAAFAELGKAPTQGALKLNETTRFLTVSVLEQIRALEEQGRVTEAARVAQNAYANEGIARSKELEAQLGSLESWLRKVAEGAKAAGDAILNIGRPDTKESLFDRYTVELQRLRDAASGPTGVPRDPSEGTASAMRAKQLRELLDGLARAAYEESKLAAQQRAGAGAVTEEYEKARKANERWTEAALSNSEKMNKALETYRRNLAREQSGPNPKGVAQIAKEEQAIRDSFKEREKAAKAESTLLAELSGLTSTYTKDLKELQAQRDKGNLSEERYIELVEALIQKQPFARDLARQRAEAEKDAAKAQQEYTKAVVANAAEMAKAEATEETALQRLRDEYVELTAGKEALEAQTIARLELAAAIREQAAAQALMDGAPDSGLVADSLNRQAQLLRDQIDQRKSNSGARLAKEAAKEAADANAKAAEDAAKEWQQTTDSIREGLTDAFRRAFESGEDFGTAFAKVIEREIKTRLATALAGSLADMVMAAAGLNTAGAAIGGAAGGTNYMQAGSNLASLYSTGERLYGMGQSAYNWGAGAYATYTGNMAGSTSLYTSMANSQALSAYGVSGTGATTGGVTASQGASSASGASSSAGVYALYAAIAIKSYQQAQKDYREGFRREQSSDAMNEFPVLRPIFGAQNIVDQIFRSLGLDNRSAAVLSGSTHAARLFGQAPFKLEETGITGTLGQGGFAGEQYTRFKSKGGFFRDDDFETFTAKISDALQNTLSAASSTVYKQAIEFGEALGVPAEQLGLVSKQIKVVLTSENITELSKKYGEDLSKPFEELSENGKRIAQTSEFADAVKKDFEARMGAIGDALASYGSALTEGFADAVKPLANYGETTAETVARVAGSLIGVNEVLETLGVTALAASVDGGKAAVSLLSMFGALGDLQQAAGGYLKDYYTEAERADLTTKALSKTLAEVGLTLPDSAQGFRALVEAQDLSTESGREAFGALMATAGAFATIVPSAEQAAEAARKLSGDLDVAITQALEKLGRADPYGGIQSDLTKAGASLSLSQLMGASKDDIYEFARSFVVMSSATDEAKLAVVTAAGALADLRGKADDLDLELLRATGQEQAAVNIERKAELEALGRLNPAMASVKKLIYEATDAAALWSRQLQLLTGVDSIAPDFMAGGELATYRAERIRQTLAAGGIDASVTAILGSTREDVLALWHAVGVDGKEAVLEAYGAWKQLNDEMRAAPIQKQLDELTKKFGDLSFLDPEPLSSVYQENLAELNTLQEGLDSVLGRTAKTLQEALADMLADQKALQSFRVGLGEDIFDARLRGMKPADRVASLRQRETQLFGQLGSAKDPVAVAQQLQGVIVNRIKEEADLRRVSHENQIEALREQINGAERLQRMSEQIAQFTGSMRFSDLSPLGFEDQLSAARSLYETTVAKARGGDETAMGALTGNAQAYLQEARSFFASSEGFAGVFNSVLGELDALGAVDPGLKAAQDQLTALEKISASQEALSEDVIWASDQEVAALMQIDTALASREAANQGKIDAQIKLAQAQVDELKTLVADQKAQLVQQAAIAKALTAELIKLNGTAAETATEASLAGATP